MIEKSFLSIPDASNIHLEPYRNLIKVGPRIKVEIGNPSHVLDRIKDLSLVETSISCMALIDTGSSITVVSDRVARCLHSPAGITQIYTPTELSSHQNYSGIVKFECGIDYLVQIVSCELPMPGIDCIIGRDIMSHWKFIYDGKKGEYKIITELNYNLTVLE